MDRGAWWATVHGVTKTQGLTLSLFISSGIGLCYREKCQEEQLRTSVLILGKRRIGRIIKTTVTAMFEFF